MIDCAQQGKNSRKLIKQDNSIWGSTLQVTAVMLIIKALGVVKKTVIAAVCGATAETDAFFIASEVILALCTVFFSSISISLLSMHTNRLLKEGRESSNSLINAVLRVFIPIAVVLSVVFAVFSSTISRILAPTYEGIQLQELARYIQILAIIFVFSCYYLIINVVLETDKRFLPGKGQAFLQNLFVIIAAVAFYPRMGISALLWAFVFAGMLQCFQITWSARHSFRFQWDFSSEKESIKKLLILAGPLLIGNAIYEFNDIVDKQISSGLEHGGVSILSYGASINEIVTTLIVGSLSVVMFSHYATWVAEGKEECVAVNLRQSLECLFAIIMPVMIMCLVAGDTIVGVLYGRGNFGIEAIRKTNGVVMGYAVGFFFQAARANIVKVYYAFQDTKTPMLNGAISVCANIILSIVLSRFLGTAGIALATSIAMLISVVLLLQPLRKYIPLFSFKSSIFEYGKVILASSLVGITSFFLRMILDINIYASFFIIGFYVVMLYVGLTVFFRVQCVMKVLNKIRNMVKK